MQRQEFIAKLLETNKKETHHFLLEKHSNLVDLKLAEEIKNTYYDSWTKEPQKTRNAANALEVLSEIIFDDEVKALTNWVKGIADLTEGKTEKAIGHLDKAAQIFTSLEKPYQAAQTQVSKLYALALLGRYDEAVTCGENAQKIFEKNGDELAAGKVEMNLGNIVSRRELHYKAEKYYLSARNRYLKLKELTWLTMAENGLAITYSAINDFRKAEKFYTQALNRAKQADMLVTEAEIEASMGNLALFRGKLDRALKFLELSRRKFESLEMPHQTTIAELEIADAYLELNLVTEAFEIYRRITPKLAELKMQGEEARARANLGRVAALLNETKIAQSELRKSARLYAAEKNKVGAAAVKLTEAKLELNSQNYENALKLVKETEKLLENSEDVRHKLTAKWLEGETLRNLGKYKTAENILEETFHEAVKQEQPNIAQILQNSLGKLALQTGDRRKAEKHFKKAIELIEKLRAPLPAEEFRMAFLADKFASFENLAKIYLSEGKWKKAFFYIEKARARSLAESLEVNQTIIEKEIEKENVSPKLAEKLQNLREELNWFYSRLNRADEAEIENLQREAKSREKQITDILRQIESTNTSFAQVSTSRANLSIQSANAKFKQLQFLLGNQKTLIEFINFDGIISAFIITNKKIDFIADLTTESEILSLLEGLQFQFGALRYGTKHLRNFMSELKNRADFYLQKLYEKLLEPLEFFIEKRELVIVPVGATHYVPFHALRNAESYVIETREVAYAPSAAVWQVLAEKPAQKLENALLTGFADEKIPLVNREIKTLEKYFPKSKSLLGKQATFAAFIKNAPNYDVLHLACHGQFRPENPLFSSLRLANGFVTVRDICSQKLKAGLVTLSACETGLNKIFAGDEILGLARGFLSAGANSLVLSLWTVNDQATAGLMEKFYGNLQAGQTTSAALKNAQCNFIRQNIHPYFWSSFILIGK
ncbi:MAG: CHAT domain-containing protein [Pyrinomonadaceae bacterium]